MNQSSHLSVVNRSILRENEPFKNETPEVFKLLHSKQMSEASTMNESFSTAADMSRVSSQKFSTLNIKRDHFVPKVKKKEFLNPYFFMKPPKNYGNPTSSSNFTRGFRVDNIEIGNQRMHYEKHLERTTKEQKFRDSKTAKSRKYAQYLNCTNPISTPKIHFQKPMKKYYHDGSANPSAVLRWMNTRKLGDTFIEARKDRNKSEVREFQKFRNERDILDVTDGNRRYKKYSKKGHIKGIIQNEYGRKTSLAVNRSCEDLTGVTKMYLSDTNFYKMNSSRQREGSITFG